MVAFPDVAGNSPVKRDLQIKRHTILVKISNTITVLSGYWIEGSQLV